MDAWKTIVSFWDGFLTGAMLVSGSLYNIRELTKRKGIWGVKPPANTDLLNANVHLFKIRPFISSTGVPSNVSTAIRMFPKIGFFTPPNHPF